MLSSSSASCALHARYSVLIFLGGSTKLLLTHFNASSMTITGAEIHRTAFHSARLSGVIWNRARKNGT